MAHASEIPGPEAPDLFEGTPFRTVKPLGQSGIAETWIVEHRQTHRRLVAKLVDERQRSEDQRVLRLRQEARILGRLNHPHIVSIVGIGATRAGRTFIVREYFEGRSLANEIAARGRLPLYEAVLFGCQLLSALGAAHEQGVLHRDITLENLFVAEQSSAIRCLKVLDFGLARLLPGTSVVPPPERVETATGAVIGTPRYLSPEARRGERVDARADLYAAGLVLYVLLTGRGPFDHSTPSRVPAAHTAAPMPPSQFLDEAIPPELDRAVLRALARAPADRFQSAEEFRNRLVAVLAGIEPPQTGSETVPLEAREAVTPAPNATRTESGVMRTVRARDASGDAPPNSAPMPRRGLSPPAFASALVLAVLLSALCAVAFARHFLGEG